ncbi:MAG TPA: RHS repeat-associated core domain-containing protein [Thermoanaerobaculia bacterium]
MSSTFKQLVTIQRVLAVTAILMACAPLQAARDTAMQRGFSADGVYSTSDIDVVNSFSGNLTIPIPLGNEYASSGSLRYRFNLIYNSNIWDYFAHSAVAGDYGGKLTGWPWNWTNRYGTFMKLNGEDYGPGIPPPDGSGDGVEAIPARTSNAGVGWMVSLGEMRSKYYHDNNVAQVVYIGADGQEHEFYTAIHGSSTDLQTKSADTTGAVKAYFYTRDGAYIRMRVGTTQHPTDSNWREIHLPDGTVQRFHCVADCDKVAAQWTLKEMGDPYGNLLVVTRWPDHVRPAPALSGQPNWTWTFTEYFSKTPGYKRAGDAGLVQIRQHYLRFRVTRATTWISEVRLEELDLAAYSGDTSRRAKYKLDYRNAEIHRDRESSWWSNDQPDPLIYPLASHDDRIAVSLLDKVSLPPNKADEGAATPSGQWQMKYFGDDCDKTVPQPLLPQCDATEFFSLRHWGSNDTKYRVNRVYGRLKQLKLPTGNSIAYEYAGRGYPQKNSCVNNAGLNPGGFTGMFGVSKRQLLDSAGNPEGKPTLYFARAYMLALGECHPMEFVTTVVEPPNVSPGAFKDGVTPTRVTVTFHSIYNQPTDAVCDGDPDNGCWAVREHGLPVTHHVQKVVGGVLRGLSSSTYECQASLFYDPNGVIDRVRRIAAHNLLENETTTCGQPKRSTWVRYEMSNTPECTADDLGRCTNANRREASAVTEYYDDKFSVKCSPYDGEECDPVRTIVDRSDFDGLGHYRRVVSDGNLLKKSDGSSQRSDKRTTYTRFNDGLSYDPPTSPANYPAVWILGMSTEMFVTQDGQSNVRRTMFDPATGFLTAVRTLKSTAPVDTHATAQTTDKDLLTTRYREILGEDRVVTTDYFFGGDSQSLSGSGFAEPSAGWTYGIETVSRAGAVEKVSYKGKCGQIVDPVIQQNDIDVESGLVKSSIDEFGAKTLYGYDLMGRMTSLSPPALTEAQRIPIVYTYPRLPDQDTVTMTRSGAEGAQWKYDGNGRLIEERKDMPAAKSSKVVHTYTMTGLRATKSSVIAGGASAADPVTFDYTYDIFGRETKIVPPGDGDLVGKQTTLIEYQGVREIKRDQEGLAVGAYDGHGTIGTRQSFDSHGRLIAVDENTGPGELRTRYEYDPADHLTAVRSHSGNTERKFKYDGRGFLLEEEHPELAGRAVKWRGYDSRGNPGLRKLGYPGVDDDNSYTPFDIGYRYDCSELLTAVRQLVPNRPLKSFAYQGGRIKEASRQNYVVDPAATSLPVQVPVKTVFKYDAIGRIERKTLNAGFEVFAEYQYDDLGRVTGTRYSAVTGCSSCPAGAERKLTYGYDLEHLSSITQTLPSSRSYAASMTYHPNGMLKELPRGNGVKDVFDIGVDARPRPTRIQVLKTNNAPGGWDTTITYDSEGTVEAMGAMRFRYDALRRLVGMKTPAGGASTIEQLYGYDKASNLVAMAGTLIPTNVATNRIMPERAAYDIAGNVTRLHGDPRRPGHEIRFFEAPAGSEISWYDPFNMPGRMEVYTGGSLTYGRVFIYDANDERVAVQEYGVPGEDAAPSVRERWTLRGLNNEGLREFERVRGQSAEWRWSKDYLYAGSRLIAGVTPSGGGETVDHYHTDHIGSVRLVTDAFGNPVDNRTYWAFGEEVSPRPDANRRKFAGHERDDDGSLAVIGDLDYMHARYYAGALGRFLSRDKVPGETARPQSWNRYAYARNNPVTFIDPDGRADKKHHSGAETFAHGAHLVLLVEDVPFIIIAGSVGTVGGAAFDIVLTPFRLAIPQLEAGLERQAGKPYPVFPMATAVEKATKQALDKMLFGALSAADTPAPRPGGGPPPVVKFVEGEAGFDGPVTDSTMTRYLEYLRQSGCAPLCPPGTWLPWQEPSDEPVMPPLPDDRGRIRPPEDPSDER